MPTIIIGVCRGKAHAQMTELDMTIQEYQNLVERQKRAMDKVREMEMAVRGYMCLISEANGNPDELATLVQKGSEVSRKLNAARNELFLSACVPRKRDRATLAHEAGCQLARAEGKLCAIATMKKTLPKFLEPGELQRAKDEYDRLSKIYTRLSGKDDL